MRDDNLVLERLCLEGFQSGLSWLTILRKREGFRSAFSAFDPVVVSNFGEADVARLLSDPAIVRHRGKVIAAIENSRATLRLRALGVSLADLCWSYAPVAGPGPFDAQAVPKSTKESVALSLELRRLGFGFLGPTTVYAAMQAMGLVNDHIPGCAIREEVELERVHCAHPS